MVDGGVLTAKWLDGGRWVFEECSTGVVAQPNRWMEFGMWSTGVDSQPNSWMEVVGWSLSGQEGWAHSQT